MSLNKILEKIELSDIIVAYVGTDLPLVWELTSKRRTLLKEILESSGLSDIVVEYVGTGSYIVWASTAKVFEECYQRYFERTHWTKLPLKHHPDRRSWLDYRNPLPYRMPITVHDTFYRHAMRSMDCYNTWRQSLPAFVPFTILRLSDPVHYAARCGSVDVMVHLMQQEPDESSYAATVDLAAAYGGNLGTLKYVHRRMGHLPGRQRYGGLLREETLDHAAAGGSVECLLYANNWNYRTGRNRDPELDPSPSAFEALLAAAIHGNEDTAFKLLKGFGVEPNDNPWNDPNFGTVVLMRAVESGKLGLV